MLIFSPPTFEESRMPMLNAGMGAISGWLRDQNYEFDQKSLLAECRYRNRIRWKKDYYDLSVFKREEVIEYLRGEEKPKIEREAKKLAENLDLEKHKIILASVKSDLSLLICLPILKESCKDKTVIIGGPLTLTNDLEILRLDFIDYGVIGDGELPLSNILEHEIHGEPLKNTNGLVYQKDDELVKGSPYNHPLDMKSQPYFEENLLEKLSKVYYPKEKIFPYQVGRGCTQDCSFCNYFENQEYQYKSVSKVVSELESIKKETGIKNFYFTDSNLFNDPEYVRELSKEIRERDLDIKWGSMSIILPRSQEFFNDLSASGCEFLMHGIESVSNTVLHRMRKGQSRSMVKDVLKKESNAGIKTFGFFMCDYVSESKDEYYDNVKFFEENNYLDGASVSPLKIFESDNMPLFSNPEDFDIEVQEAEYDDFIDKSFEKPIKYKEKSGKKWEVNQELKTSYLQKKADIMLHVANYGRSNPLTLLRKQVRKAYVKNYQNYTWLYA